MAISILKRRRFWNAILLLALCFASGGIYFSVTGGPKSQEEELIATAIATRLNLGEDPIDLNALVPGARWRRVCTIERFFSAHHLSSAVGKPIEEDRALRWRNIEGVWTLLFVGEDPDKLVAVRISRKDVGDLAQKEMVRCVDNAPVLVIDRSSGKSHTDLRLESSHSTYKGD